MARPSSNLPARRRRWPWVLAMVGAAFATVILVLMVDAYSALGSKPSGAHLDRISRSPNYQDGRFRNTLPTVSDGLSWTTFRDFLLGGSDYRQPSVEIPVHTPAPHDPDLSAPSLRVTWLGHSTLLIELDGSRILVDPVWGPRASPSRFVGSRRFYDPPLALEDLPPIDAVVISHDHYDHLDLPTVRALASRVRQWLVPLGLGAHLEGWGVQSDKIREFDWWDEMPLGPVRVVSTPARHFSGRGLTDRDATLWSGWAFLGSEARVWYSGDTALTTQFHEIGERLGPFDLTLIETGAYNESWTDVHLGPEQAVRAHQMVGGGLMVPVHWGLFDLALHGWTEPAERVRAAAASSGVRVAFPRPGESLTLNEYPVEPWWPSLPWETALEAPIISTGLAESLNTNPIAQ